MLCRFGCSLAVDWFDLLVLYWFVGFNSVGVGVFSVMICGFVMLVTVLMVAVVILLISFVVPVFVVCLIVVVLEFASVVLGLWWGLLC